METIREMIEKRVSEILNRIEVLNKHEVSVYLVELSALHSKVEQEMIEKEIAYCAKLEEIQVKDPELSYARAKNISKTTPEYREYRIREGYQKSLIELTRALKKRIVVLAEDWEASINQ